MTECEHISHPASSPSPKRTGSPPPCSFSRQVSQTSAPVGGTPPSPGPRRESEASLGKTTSHRSHQEYLDSLQPPSGEEFERLAKLQEQREKEHKHRNQELRRHIIIDVQMCMKARQDFMLLKAAEHATPSSGNALQEAIRTQAAIVIQRTYRGYRVRREIQGLGLDASTRWTHAIRDARWKELNTPRARRGSAMSAGSEDAGSGTRPSTSRSVARQNWMKVAAIARHAGADEDSSPSSSDHPPSSPAGEELSRASSERRAAEKKKRIKTQDKRREHARMMGLQYFLEMVDLKHRYGSNLTLYHEEWKKSDTNENFFYWLDFGEGRLIDLVACPRDRLDREQVRYLSREERQYYLVKVDSQGRLVWAKNGQRIDTTEDWKDSLHGIVRVDDPTPAFAPALERHAQETSGAGGSPEPHDHSSFNTFSASSRESRLEAARAAKYTDPDFDSAKGVKKIRRLTVATIFNKLLRKTVRRNTWIFVADTSFRLYVGIKTSGAFQHSSFLQGSRISAAGLIKIKNGRLSSLSPLSGHYRPPASNFRAFVRSLEEEGADMSHVSISRSYAVLVGLELYVRIKRKGKEAARALRRQKQRLLDPEAARRAKEAELDTSESAAKERRILEKERKDEEHEREEARRLENRTAFKFIQRLGHRPTAPARPAIGDASTHDSVTHTAL